MSPAREDPALALILASAVLGACDPQSRTYVDPRYHPLFVLPHTELDEDEVARCARPLAAALDVLATMPPSVLKRGPVIRALLALRAWCGAPSLRLDPVAGQMESRLYQLLESIASGPLEFMSVAALRRERRRLHDATRYAGDEERRELHARADEIRDVIARRFLADNPKEQP